MINLIIHCGRVASRLRQGLMLASFGMIMLASMGFVSAMATVTVPGSVNPGQVEKRLEAPAPAPGQLELNIPAPVETQQIPEKLRQELEKNKFVLKSVAIEGATVYKPEDLKFAYQDMIGKTISLLDAKAIALNITDLYHKDGYILSQAIVPAQSVSGGILKIRVIEGYIGHISYQGDERSEGEKHVLESFSNHIEQQHPANVKDLERYLLLMNDLPGADVRGLIRPSADGLGSADLVLTVTHKEFGASYSLDNRGSKYLGPWQHTASVDANSLFGLYDHTQLRAITTMPFKELVDVQLEHDEALDSEGTRAGFLVSHTRTQPGDSLKVLDVIGYSDLFEARVTHPFLRSRQESFVGRVVMDVNNTTTNVFVNQPLATDRLRIARIGGNYAFLDGLRGNNTFDAQLSQGMNIFNATSSGIVRSNANGDSAFTKANFDVSRLQALPNNFSLLLGATGQYSFSPLLTEEQFSLGGSEYGRAFDPSELLGDSGLAGKVELRYGEPVNKPYFQSYQVYAYSDIGELWIRDAAAGTANSGSLASVGVGTRVNFTSYLASSVELSAPTIKPQNDQTSYRHDPRIFFTLAAHY